MPITTFDAQNAIREARMNYDMTFGSEKRTAINNTKNWLKSIQLCSRTRFIESWSLKMRVSQFFELVALSLAIQVIRNMQFNVIACDHTIRVLKKRLTCARLLAIRVLSITFRSEYIDLKNVYCKNYFGYNIMETPKYFKEQSKYLRNQHLKWVKN